MDDCLFCRIVAGKIPAKVVYTDDLAIAVHDVFPQAPFHVLVLPRRHVARLSKLEDEALGGRLLQVARRVAADAGHGSYRVVANTGAQAGQSIEHLHLHVLAGRDFAWPPG